MEWHCWGDWRGWSREGGGGIRLLGADVDWLRDSGEGFASVSLLGLNVSVRFVYARERHRQWAAGIQRSLALIREGLVR